MLSVFLVLKRIKRQWQTRKEDLQKDVIAGLKRLAEVHPHMVKEVKHLLN